MWDSFVSMPNYNDLCLFFIHVGCASSIMMCSTPSFVLLTGGLHILPWPIVEARQMTKPVTFMLSHTHTHAPIYWTQQQHGADSSLVFFVARQGEFAVFLISIAHAKTP